MKGVRLSSMSKRGQHTSQGSEGRGGSELKDKELRALGRTFQGKGTASTMALKSFERNERGPAEQSSEQRGERDWK